MNPRIVLLFASLALGSVTVTAASMGTVFNYQGLLTQAGAPYTGIAEMQATLWDASTGGAQVAANSPPQVTVAVTNGLFVLPLDFGASPFVAGTERWLKLEVRTTIGPFTELLPRQNLTPTPYALYGQYASYASSAGSATTASAATVAYGTTANAVNNSSLLANSVTTDKILNGTITDADISASGISGDKIVGGDLQALRLKVGQGHGLNGSGATIAGGSTSLIGTGADYSAIGGGLKNTNGSPYAVIAGGWNNNVGTNSGYGVIGGGRNHWIGDNASLAVIGGGGGNSALADHATVPGGRQAVARNYAQMAYSSGAFNIPGDCQTSFFVAKNRTSGAVTRELFLEMNTSQRMIVPANTTWTFQILVSARSSAGEAAGYTITGMIGRAGDITYAPVYTVTPIYESDAAWNVTVAADDANDALVIWVTGNTGDDIRWVASVRTAEVSW